MSEAEAQLAEAALELQRLLDSTRAQLQAQCDQDNRYASVRLSPDTMRDSTGRFILLDAQVALVQALTALQVADATPAPAPDSGIDPRLDPPPDTSWLKTEPIGKGFSAG